MSCQKLIEVPGSTCITLQFTSFATEAGYDFVKVYDGATTSSPLLGQFSGTSLPPLLYLNRRQHVNRILYKWGIFRQQAGVPPIQAIPLLHPNCVDETFTAMTGTLQTTAAVLTITTACHARN